MLALTLAGQRARAFARPAEALEVSPESDLVSAAVTRFAREAQPSAARSAVQWTTSIARAVGLGGSSAIVIATLRALCSLHAVTLDATERRSWRWRSRCRSWGSPPASRIGWHRPTAG